MYIYIHTSHTCIHTLPTHQYLHPPTLSHTHTHTHPHPSPHTQTYTHMHPHTHPYPHSHRAAGIPSSMTGDSLCVGIPHRPHGISPPHGTSLSLSVSLPLAASLGVSVSLSNESIATGKLKHTLVSPSPLVDNVSKKIYETYQTYHMFASVSPSPPNKSNLWKSSKMGGFHLCSSWLSLTSPFVKPGPWAKAFCVSPSPHFWSFRMASPGQPHFSRY